MGLLTNIKKSLFFGGKVSDLKKSLKVAMDGILRPFGGDFFNQNVHLFPKFPYGKEVLSDLAHSSDVLTTIHNALRRELFRNGYDLVEAENTDDNTTSSEDESVMRGSRRDILKFLENINENGQRLMDVLYELEDDLSIHDDAYMLFIKDYYFNSVGGIIPDKTELSQVLRVDPRYMGLIINKYDRPGFDDNNTELFACPEHRDRLLEGIEVCPKCSKQCYRVHYFADYGSERIYYFKDEVVHKSKYRPSKRFGHSPVITVWQKVRTLLFMDQYIMQLYDGQRPPKAGLFFKTSNQAGLSKAWDEAKERAKENPHLPIIMGVPDTSNGQGFVEFIDFMKSLDELQYTEARNEMRRQVGAVYGVEPLFQGDISQSGGLNSEGLQITVTNRTVEYGQRLYNEYFFTAILDALRVEGYVLKLKPSEEQDEMAKLERQSKSLANGMLAAQMGLEVEYDDDTWEAVIRPGQITAPIPQSFTGEGDPAYSNDLTAPTLEGSPVSVKLKKKVEPIYKGRKPFSKISDTIKREIDKVLNKFKRKPSESKLQKAIAEINFKLHENMKEASEGLFNSVYVKEMDKVGDEFGINVLFGAVDKNALEVLMNQSVLSKAYEGIVNELTENINDTIREAYRTPAGLTTEQITEKIKQVADISDFRAENIARSETSKVSAAARKNSYAKEEDFDTFLFKHIGPNDNRTTSTSKRIKSRTKNGVKWAEYVKVVEEESAKDFPEWTVNKDFPVSHYSSRHLFVRVG